MATDTSYCSSNFQADLSKLKKDAAQFEADKKAQETAEANAAKEAEKSFKGDPAALLIFLIVHVYGGAADNSFQLQLKTESDAVQIQADLSKLSNNINNEVNSGDKGATITINGKPYNKGIVNVAAELDEMQKVLGTSTDPTSTQFALNDALGTASCSLLKGNFQNMRETINWGSDPDAATYNQGTNCDFNPDSSATRPSADTEKLPYINSFSAMKAGLSQQGNTVAQNGYKTFLDNYNQNVSATQSLGTAANAEIGLITGKIKTLVNFESAMIQDTLTGNRTAVKNQIAQ